MVPDSASAVNSSAAPMHIEASRYERGRLHHDREDHGRDAEDQENVGDVGADDIADRDAGQAVDGRLQTHHQFGRRGAVGDDGHADDHRRDLQSARESYCAAHQIFGSEQQQDEAADELQSRNHGLCSGTRHGGTRVLVSAAGAAQCSDVKLRDQIDQLIGLDQRRHADAQEDEAAGDVPIGHLP